MISPSPPFWKNKNLQDNRTYFGVAEEDIISLIDLITTYLINVFHAKKKKPLPIDHIWFMAFKPTGSI